MTRLLIVARTRFYRDGLAEVLPTKADLQVIGTFPDCSTALLGMQDVVPDIVLLDTAVEDGLQMVRTIAHQDARIRVVAIAITERPDRILTWAEAGISGYVSTECSIDELVDIILTTRRGDLRCSPKVAGAMLRHLGELAARAQGTSGKRGLHDLTSRERQIVALIDRGWSNKRIASRLDISLATVKNHVHNVLRKLDVRKRGEAAAVLRRAGALPPPDSTSTATGMTA